MSCKIGYIEKAPISETEKTRLEGIHVDVIDKAKASGAFRVSDNKLLSKKNDFGSATKVVSNLNAEYKFTISKLQKVKSTGNTEQFALAVNVLPLSNEQQGDLSFIKTNIERSTTIKEWDNPDLKDYLPNTSNEAKPVLEKLLADEGDIEAKKGMQVMLNNIDKLTTPINVVPQMEGDGGVYDSQSNEIEIDPNAFEDKAQLRRFINHELHHAFSVGVITDPRTDLEKEFVSNVNRIYSDLLTNNPSSKAYGLTNTKEFIAELASNRKFRQSLNGTSIISRIIRAIRRLLGQSSQYDKLLQQYYDVLDQVQDPNRPVRGNRVRSFVKAAKVPKAAKKKLDAIEEFISALTRRKQRYEHQNQGKKRQETEADIKTIKTAMQTNRQLAILKALAVAEREMADLKELYDNMEKDYTKLNPDVLANIGIQLDSYEVLKSISRDIRNNPTEYVGSEEGAKKLTALLDDLRSRINEMTGDVKDLRLDYVAWEQSKNTANPKATFEKIREQAEVADRDMSLWSRMAESIRGIVDPIAAGIFKTVDRVYSKAHRDNVTEDIYRKEAKNETVHYKTRMGGDWFDNVINFKSMGIVKAEAEYKAWLKKTGRAHSTLTDIQAPIINKETLQQNANGVLYISPLSPEGKKILSIPEGSENYPLRQYYSTIVLGKLKAEEAITNPALRGGLRLPSIGRSMLEGVINGTGSDRFKSIFQHSLHEIQKRADDTDFRAVDENMEPIHYLPIRFTARHDGREGRLSTREVSMDLAATTAVYMNEMRTREGMSEVVSELELSKKILGERKVVKASRRLAGFEGILSSERVASYDPESGQMETIAGIESNVYKAVDTFLRRNVYGEFKKGAGEVNIFGQKIDVRKGLTKILQYTGMNIMLGNIAIPLTNLAVGKLTMLKEAVGGNLINFEDLKAGEMVWKDFFVGGLTDLAQKEKASKAGRTLMYFNPFGKEKASEDISIHNNWMAIPINLVMSTGSSLADRKIVSEAIGSTLNRFKVKDAEGKEHSMYDALEYGDNGKPHLKKGYTYKGKHELTENDIDEVRDYTARVYELVYGNYSKITSPGATEHWWGDALFLMRKWLPEGVAARYKTRYYDEALQKENEGYHVSALAAFNGIFTRGEGVAPKLLDTLRILTFFGVSDPELLLLPHEMNLSQEEKDSIIELRKAGVKKAVFDLYVMTALTMVIMALSGGDDDDSYIKYMAIRIRREMLTFVDPSNAWDVLRSPSVMMNTLGGMHRIIADLGREGMAYGEDDPSLVYKSGVYKGQRKLWADIQRQTGISSWLYQFDDLDKRSRLMQGGGWR